MEDMRRCGAFRQVDMPYNIVRPNGLNRNQIKYIAVAAMLLDHLASAYMPRGSVAWEVMRFFGRIAGPVMAYMVTEGYIHTSNRVKYGLRLLIFAVISWIPYTYFELGLITYSYSVIYTLFLGYLAVWIWDRAPFPDSAKLVFTGLLCYFGTWGDWGCYNVMWVFFLYVFRDDPRAKWISFSLIGLANLIETMYLYHAAGMHVLSASYQLGVFIAPFLLGLAYNGQSGKRNAFNKWFFYVFYPLHLLIMGIMRYNGWACIKSLIGIK